MSRLGGINFSSATPFEAESSFESPQGVAYRSHAVDAVSVGVMSRSEGAWKNG